MYSNLSIGQIISELRKSKGSTQEELANAVGISAQAVSKWENGGMPDTELLPAIADFFDIPIDRLFGRKISPKIEETVHDYIFEFGQFRGFEKAFDIYHSIHDGLTQPAINNIEKDKILAYHNSHENGYSLMVSNGYGNIVKREFWESIDLKTLSFSQDLFFVLSEPGVMEVIYAVLRRKFSGPANFEMIRTALENTNCSDEDIQNGLNKLISKKIIITEISPYDEIGETYRIDEMWYLGLCAVICASQALKISLPGISCYLGIGAWPIKLL